MSLHRLDLVEKGIDTLMGLKDLAEANFISINLRSNHITNFNHFGAHPCLVELDVRDNKITSLLGLTKQRSLKTVFLEGNPIASHPFYRVMILMTVGYSVTAIDSFRVSPEEYKIARDMGKHAALAVSYGWHLSLTPYSPQQYASIIRELKEAARRGGRRGTRSVVNALNDIYSPDDRGKAAGSEPPLKKSEVIQRLTKRINDLEEQIQSFSPQVALLENNDQVAVLDASTRGLTPTQLKCMTALFTEGITVRENVRKDLDGKRICVEVNRETVSLLDFMSRNRMLELRTSELDCQYTAPSVLLLSDSFGAAVELHFTDISTLCTMYKLLYLLQGKPIPLQPFMQKEDEALEVEKVEEVAKKVTENGSKSSSVRTAKLTSKASVSFEGASASVHSSSGNGKRKTVPSVSPSTVTPASPAHTEDTEVITPRSHRTASIEDEKGDSLSNIADVPPLASPHDHSNATQNYELTFPRKEAAAGAPPLPPPGSSDTAAEQQKPPAAAPPSQSRNQSRFSAFLISDSSTEASFRVTSTRNAAPATPSAKESAVMTASATSSKRGAGTAKTSAASSLRSVATGRGKVDPSLPSLSTKVSQTPSTAEPSVFAPTPAAEEQSISFQMQSPEATASPSKVEGNTQNMTKFSSLDISRFRIIDSDSDSSDE